MDLRAAVAVAELTVKDAMSAGMQAAADATAKLTAAIDTQDATIKKATPSAEALVRKLDAITSAEATLASATARTARERATLDAGLQAGTISADQYAGAIGKHNTQLAAAEAALQKARGAASATAASFDQGGKSTKQAAYEMRQLALQTPDVVQGLLGGQSAFQVLVQQGGQVVQVMGSVGAALRGVGSLIGSALTTPIGLLAVAAAGLGALGYAANSAQQRIIDLQNTLRGTRDDYASLAVQVDATAKKLAASTSLGSGEARQAAGIIASSSAFSGSSSQLEDLTKLAKDLAVTMGTDLPTAAKQLADALKNPGAEAQRLADGGLRTMSQALADSIKLQDAAGDKAGAFSRVLAAQKAAVGGAADDSTTLGKSLRELSEAFTKAGADGRSLSDVLGGAINDAAAVAIGAITGVVNAIQDMRNRAGQPQTAPGLGLQGNAATTPDATGRQLYINPQSVNGENATGIFQVLPSTGRSLGYNVANQDQNILAGLTYLRDQTQRTGSLSGGLAQYGGYGTNVTAAAGYISKVGSANAASLPADVAGQIEYWGQVLGMSPDMIAVGKRLAVVESRGRQYADSSAGAAAGGLPSTPDSRANLAGRGDLAGFRDLSPDQIAGRQLLNQAQTQYSNSGVLSTLSAKNQAEQSLAQRGIDQAKAVGDDAAVKHYSEVLADARGKATELIDAQQKLARQAVDAVAPLQAEEGATRDVATIRQKYVELARSKGVDVNEGAVAIDVAAKLRELGKTYDDNIAATDRATAGQLRINATLEGGGVTAERAANREKALEAARKAFLPGTVQRADAEDRLTASLNKSTDANRNAQALQDVNQYAKQIELTRTELGLLTSTADERARELAILQERQKLGLKYGEQATADQQKALDAAAAAASLGLQLQQQQASLTAIGQGISQAFDQVGSAITQAFVGGQGAAVNWGNVTRGVITSVLQQVVKLAVLNPILNSLTGQSNPTLYAGLAALTGGGTGTTAAAGGGSFGLSDLFSYGSTASSVSGALGGPSIGSALGITGPGGYASQIGNYLGLTGSGSIFATGASGIGAGGTSIVGASIGQTVPLAAADGFASTSGGGAAGILGGGAATSALAGIGLGFAGGSYLNQLIRGNQENGTIGAGGGALAGAAIGTLIAPGVGTLLGGLFGGLAGGAGGGLLGSKIHKAYGINIGVNDGGTLAITSAQNNHEASYAAALQQQQQEVDSINRVLDQAGLKVNPETKITIGKGNSNPDGSQLTQAGDLTDEFSRIRFRSESDTDLNRAIGDQSFADPQALATFLDGFNSLKALLPTLIDPLKKVTEGVGTYGDAVAATSKTYDDAIASAKQYQMSTTDLETAKQQVLDKLRDDANKEVAKYSDAWKQRYMAATGDSTSAQLVNFDANAQQQRDEFHDFFVNMFGPASDASADYVNEIGELNKTLAVERKQIEDANSNQARSQVSSAIDSLTSFARSLQTGQLSPLSAQDQYASTAARFTSVGNAAVSGDFKSLQNIQAYATDFLNASRNLNGSGQAYTADYNQVISLLQSVADAAPEALTASAMAQIQQDATQKLTASLTDLGVAVAGAQIVSGQGITGALWADGGDTRAAFARYASAIDIASQAAAARAQETAAYLAGVNYQATADGFASIVTALSHVGGSDLNTANMANITQGQTDQLVGWLAAIRDQVLALRQEMQQAALAPNTVINNYEGNNSAGGSDRG